MCSPVSPCVTLQCTYRDGEITNLPWALLVKGDCIVMRPGQTAIGPCKELNGTRTFQSGETYSQNSSVNPPKRPAARVPLPNLVCVMESTPYLENLCITINEFYRGSPGNSLERDQRSVSQLNIFYDDFLYKLKIRFSPSDYSQPAAPLYSHFLCSEMGNNFCHADRPRLRCSQQDQL